MQVGADAWRKSGAGVQVSAARWWPLREILISPLDQCELLWIAALVRMLLRDQVSIRAPNLQEQQPGRERHDRQFANICIRTFHYPSRQLQMRNSRLLRSSSDALNESKLCRARSGCTSTSLASRDTPRALYRSGSMDAG